MTVNRNRRVGDIIADLDPTQEHFLKKYLLEHRLSQELHLLNSPNCCELLGPPFLTSKPSLGYELVPGLRFFFSNFITTFPFIASISQLDQIKFWQQTVQKFVTAVNIKRNVNHDAIPPSSRKRFINKKMLSGLLIFFNAMIVTDKDMKYLRENHVKSMQSSSLQKIHNPKTTHNLNIDMNDYSRMKFFYDTNINVVAVRRLDPAEEKTSWWTLSLGSSPTKSQDEFILQVTRRIDNGAGYDYSSHYIAHSYGDFKKLECDLRGLLPGIMATKVFPLANKLKQDNGIATDSSSKLNKLYREKLRLSLRGWLNSLIEYPEVFHSVSLQKFINDPGSNFVELNKSDLADHEYRIAHEQRIIQTQQEFQNRTINIVARLASEFDKFKADLIANPQALNDFVEMVGATEDIQKSPSTLLQLFNKCSKIEIAATVYEWFLGSDRATPTLEKCVRFNRLIPHGLIYNILRFTNPVQMVARGLDLMFLPLPSFSFTKWGSSKKENQETGSRNLLTIAFVTLLEEDLNNFDKELQVLQAEKLPEDCIIFVTRIKNYFTLPGEICREIQEESYDKSQDLLITVLGTSRILPKITTDNEKFHYNQIVQSYEAYKNIGDCDEEDMELYLALKQCWQLELKMKEKEFFKLLWQDKETTNFIRGFMTVFYQPLLHIMNKAQIHIAYKDFHEFLNDILDEMVTLNNGEKYYLDTYKLLDRITTIMTKHENALWKFIHNVYSHDDKQIFKGIIGWVTKYLQLLRTKFTNQALVQLNLQDLDAEVDEDLFMKQLNARTSKIIQKRQLFKDYIETKSKLADITTQDKVNAEWDNIHGNIVGNEIGISEFGIDIEDLEELNNLNREQNLDTEEIGYLERELREKLHKLETSEDYGTCELDKLDNSFKVQLSALLQKLELHISGQPGV